MGTSLEVPSGTGTGGWCGMSVVGIKPDSLEGWGVGALSSLTNGAATGSGDIMLSA